MMVNKRNGLREPFDKHKIMEAVFKAMKGAGVEQDKPFAAVVADVTAYHLDNQDDLNVEDIHRAVENTLMDMKEHQLAREYITYRERNKPDVFSRRIEIKPYDYPHLLEYIDAIRHSYWIHTEFNYSADIQDLSVNLGAGDRQIVTRAMLAISQIESAVKTFWGKVGDHLPKPEIAKVGATFAESEVRHEDAYSHLLEITGLNSEFAHIRDNKAMKGRIKYLDKANYNKDSADPEDYLHSIILFSILVENVSLFSQFLILMSYNQHMNVLKGISNAVEATSKEENVHAMFGIDLVKIIREENPQWWTDELVEDIIQSCAEAIQAEWGVLDWIYEDTESDAIPKAVCRAYIVERVNRSLADLDIEWEFVVPAPELLEEVEWFDDEISLSKNYDFFNKRSTAYSKKQQSITAEDLF